MSEDLVNDIKNAVSVINDPHMGVSIIEINYQTNKPWLYEYCPYCS